MSNANEQRFMQMALGLAARGLGRVEPNPMVGCVVVKGGRVVARGWHKRFGGPHAEVHAIRQRPDLRGCDVYVTLEPCCHFGKTPPCTDALIRARPRRVVVAMIDPFPAVSGKGVKVLRRAGIRVEVGLCENPARRLNAPFIKRLKTGLPWVIAKWAQTLDGRIAGATGDSKWISNEDSRREAHHIRARVDAVIAGIGTVLADDPLLTARKVAVLRAARRVVIDPGLEIPLSSKLIGRAGPPVIIAAAPATLRRHRRKAQTLRAAGVELLPLPSTRSDPGHLNLRPLLRHLAVHHGAGNVMVEGGGRVLGSFFRQRLVDQAIVFIAPRLLGDSAAVPAVAGLSAPRITDGVALKLESLHRRGNDIEIRCLC